MVWLDRCVFSLGVGAEVKYLDVGLAPSAVWRALPLRPLAPWDPLPHTSLGRPIPEHSKTSQGGRGEREGREGLWARGQAPPVAVGGMGTYIWGLSGGAPPFFFKSSFFFF